MGDVLTGGKNSIWWAYVDRLSDNNVYPKEHNVVPFVSNNALATNKLLFIDFVPDLYNPTADVFLRIFQDGNEITPATGTKIQDASGLLYQEFQLSKPGEFKIRIKSVDLATTYREYTFTAKNLYLLTEVFGVEIAKIRAEQEKIKGDAIWNTVRDEKLSQNFATLYGVSSPPIFTADQFRLMLLGSDLEPGIRRAILKAGSIRGVKDAVRAITGVDPVITDFKTTDGFITFDKNPGPLPDDPDALPEYYSFDSDVPPSTGFDEDEVIVTYDGRFLDFSFVLLSKNSIRKAIQEAVVRNPNSISTADILINKNIIPSNGIDYVVINQGATIYHEGGEFTVNRETGTITWGATRPADKSVYYVDYKFYLKDIIIPMVERVKPAACNIIYEFE